ncbi:hypothetical protein K431DRAFT_282303 [Polychaeton citri CBS 116435]|uniref:Putative phospholipase n=1 Tax=Polychaeton citri CBS 116435 TaxID=1314669 RepID=A0A9P4USU7_9PEZI|nr:hypothetical protein K431DRAFT_282303 [Polychaeton citri CBS 116435]
MPLLSSPLPKYDGPYDVGTVDIEAPCERRQFGDVHLKDTGAPAFELETVLFTIFYPAAPGTKSKKEKHQWVPRPIRLQGEGYARFARINNAVTNRVFSAGLWALAGSTSIPAKVDVPLHGTTQSYYNYPAEQPLDSYGLPTFPVLIFSHGMASGRTSYTHYLASLASRGYIVAAIEHRDGSGPGTVVNRPDGSQKTVFHISQRSINLELEIDELKKLQLSLREAEVEETLRVLREINDGRGSAIYKANPRKEGVVLTDWHGRIDLDHVVIGGHSYGATLALQALKGSPTNAARPFIGGIILDPGKSSGPLNDEIDVPIIIVHSDSWSSKHSIFYGRPHFDTVKELTQKVTDKRKKFAWFMTCRNTTHPTVTDAPLIEPLLLSWTTGATVDVKEGVLHYVRVSEHFMQFLRDEQRRGALAADVSHPEYGQETHWLIPQVGNYWQVHVSPETVCPAPFYCGVQYDNCANRDEEGRCVP